jgi:hypothetical protein
MFRLTRNHHQTNYSHSIQYISVCAYIMGSYVVYSDVKIGLSSKKWPVYYESVLRGNVLVFDGDILT